MCPMTSAKTYHALAVRRLPSLTQLDGETITTRNRHLANTRGASISPSVLRAACKFRPSKLTSIPAAAAAASGAQNGVIPYDSMESAASPGTASRSVTALAALNPIPVARTQPFMEAHASTTLTLRHNDSMAGGHGEPSLSDAVEVVLQVCFAKSTQLVACSITSRLEVS